MAAPRKSKIAWTDYSSGDANFTWGCTPTSAGCAHCYAAALAQRWGRDFSKVEVDEDKLARLRRWRPTEILYKRGLASTRPMVFVCDLSDLFHPDVPDLFIMAALETLAYRKDVDWQVLTKRIDRAALWADMFEHAPNIWLGTTVENQRMADERLPILSSIPAAVRWVSAEPLLERVDLLPWLAKGALSWVVCGAESGPRRRPFDPLWAEFMWIQCESGGVPFFGKQDSGLRPGTPLLVGGEVRHNWPQAGGGKYEDR